MARARLGPGPADPRRRWVQAVEAARGAGRRRLSRRDGLSARGGEQLSSPPGLGPRRCGNHRPRPGGPMVRPRQRRPLALALRCQEAGNLNGHYLREADNARLAGLVAPRVETLVDRALDDADRSEEHTSELQSLM